MRNLVIWRDFFASSGMIQCQLCYILSYSGILVAEFGPIISYAALDRLPLSVLVTAYSLNISTHKT
jgi:hypothetical protein